METKIWKVDNYVDNLEKYPQIIEAAKLLQQNEVVAFPTETVYGLGGNAKSDEAVKKIYEAKGRPSDNPLIIHISKTSDVDNFVTEIPEHAQTLMEHFWPGPLTIILKQKQGVLSTVATANSATVAIRMPSHPVARAIIEVSGLPIAAPSANLSGKPSPTNFAHVALDLTGKISGIVDGGETGVGVESTVLDCTDDIPTILRPGGVTKEQLEALIGEVRVDPALVSEDSKPKAPGMKYTHYAPNAPMVLVEGSREFLQSVAQQYRDKGNSVGILTTDEQLDFYVADRIISCGKRAELSTVAHNLYDVLRKFDQEPIDIILSETFPENGIGSAIMNRLTKAAGHHVISEHHSQK
ncbi:L-threonylcarbamoyladenylate synthase [Caldibacillus lycopersici]|uniref:Threonylcarbamoyl-AMP synthase n=1 Tax=Perspicuibacillus lycopersici TaxID=1325689 RepID=A0AAE3ITR5_9BACI|nr:L-threonylcarbamoyladenylate synthase [Perspicuibacillus lycopersici]MCU9613311.1 L-threonylcarbamoyladenylate synthase [Perspicuibacillus lycopersici]